MNKSVVFSAFIGKQIFPVCIAAISFVGAIKFTFCQTQM